MILLEDQANFLEKELVIKYARLSELKKEIIWEKVQETLGPSEVAIEFFDYKLFTKNLTDSINYAALVLLPNDTTPHFVPLFEEKEINCCQILNPDEWIMLSMCSLTKCRGITN